MELIQCKRMGGNGEVGGTGKDIPHLLDLLSCHNIARRIADTGVESTAA